MKTRYAQVLVRAYNLKSGKERVFAVPVVLNKTLCTIQEQVKLQLNINEVLKEQPILEWEV